MAWTFDAGGPIEAAPAVLDDGTIVVGTLHGKLFGLTPDGTQKFVVDLGERIYSSPLVWQGNVLIGTDRGKFLGLQPNGAARWKLETDGDADTGAAWTPLGTVVFASGKVLYAARPDGTLAWRIRARRKMYSSPAVAEDGTVFVGSQDDHVYAIGPDGKLRWRVSAGADVDTAPALGDDGTVFVGTDAGEVLAMSPTDGAVRWRKRVGGFVRGALSITRDGTVMAGTYGPRPRMVGLWPDDGSQRFEFAIRGTGAAEFGIHGAPVEDAQGRLYFGAQDDFVYALSPNWELLWKFSTQGDVDAPLVITPAGVLLVGSDDGKIYALRGKPRRQETAAAQEPSGPTPAGGAAIPAVLSAPAGPVPPTVAASGAVVTAGPVPLVRAAPAEGPASAAPAGLVNTPAVPAAVGGVPSLAVPNGGSDQGGDADGTAGPETTTYEPETAPIPGASVQGSSGVSGGPAASGSAAGTAPSAIP